MSVEKMKMIDMVGHIDNLNEIAKRVVLSKSMHLVNAFQEINTTNFKLSTTEKNLEALMDVCYIRPYTKDNDYTLIKKKMKKLKDLSKNYIKNYVAEDELITKYEDIEKNIYNISEKIQNICEQLKKYRQEKERITKTIEYLKFFKNLNISFKDVKNLKYFSFDFYKISKQNSLKLKENYQNIPAIVISIYTEKEYGIVMSFSPKTLNIETEKIFKSLNCESLTMPEEYQGSAMETRVIFKEKLQKIDMEIPILENKLNKFFEQNSKIINILDKSLDLEIKSQKLKENIAYTDEFFYLSGWVPESMIEGFKKKLNKYEKKLIIIEKNPEEIMDDVKTPTKLKNNFIVKPFESMVNMYGIPSYKEIDPTNFLGITYMIIFGAMFGDLGQGLIFVLLGLFLKYKKVDSRPNLGGVIVRLGISSSIFGMIYGSVFGFEDVIEPLYIRPMDNIMKILAMGIGFGCMLLIVGFSYSIINKCRRKNMKEGIFGKNGLVGMLLYILILGFAITKYMDVEIFPSFLWSLIFIVLLVIMVFKEPLANLVQGKRPLYSEKKSDYFVEGTFGLMETLISLFSNTISFIRVGAFALNHVGLFLAFAALANMSHNKIGSVSMYILANIVIITLEGLIVFIQGLRLQYYELFSKYYEGEGISFKPIEIAEGKGYKFEQKMMKKMRREET